MALIVSLYLWMIFGSILAECTIRLYTKHINQCIAETQKNSIILGFIILHLLCIGLCIGALYGHPLQMNDTEQLSILSFEFSHHYWLLNHTLFFDFRHHHATLIHSAVMVYLFGFIVSFICSVADYLCNQYKDFRSYFMDISHLSDTRLFKCHWIATITPIGSWFRYANNLFKHFLHPEL